MYCFRFSYCQQLKKEIMNFKKITIGILALVLIAFIAYNLINKQEKQVLDVYNWAYYMEESLLKDFEEANNCIINYKEFPTNEDLLSDLENNSTAWDVVFPSDYMVEIMVSKGLLAKLSKDKLHNLSNMNDGFMNQTFDKENNYSLPYIWGCSGIGYNTNNINNVNSYSVLWDKANSGKIGILDDIRFSIAIPLMWKGYSINTTNQNELSLADSLLVAQKPLVKAYNSDSYVDLLKSGEVDLMYGYSGDIIQAVPEFSNLAFTIPKEGGVLYIDNMCIPKKSDNPDLAHKFINYLMEAEVAATIINNKWFAMPNKAAEALVKPAIKNNKGVYPPQEVLDKCQMIQDIGDDVKLYEDIWKRLK